MHEASIAQNIMEITRQYCPPDQSIRIKSVRLKIGECAGVEPESLRFCFEALTTGTDMQGATLEIERVPFMILCDQCGHETHTEFGWMICGHCQGTGTRVISGNEMQVTEIETGEEIAI